MNTTTIVLLVVLAAVAVLALWLTTAPPITRKGETRVEPEQVRDDDENLRAG